jgi:hypothetical protein
LNKGHLVLVTVFFGFCLFNKVNGQDSTFVRSIVKELSSPKYGGRGYLDSGLAKSSKKIQDYLTTFGYLDGSDFTPSEKEIRPSFSTQNFSFNVNTFIGTIKMDIDGKEKYAGIHFIMNPNSKGIKLVGKHFITLSDSKNISLTKTSCDVLILGTEYASNEERKELAIKNYNPKLVIILADKLTYSVGKKVKEYCEITYLNSAWDKNLKSLSILVENKFVPNFNCQNIIVQIPSSNHGIGDSLIYITAHYDHLGKMGKDTYFPGANDNASGTAAALDFAKYWIKNPLRNKKIIILFFAGEEAGLIGSEYYVTHLNPSLKSHSKFVVNLDLWGNGSEGATVVNATEFKKEWEILNNLNIKYHYLPKLNQRGKAKNSDHFWFTENNIPSFFIYLQGNNYTNYHDVYDDEKRLFFTGYYGAFNLVKDFINTIQ